MKFTLINKLEMDSTNELCGKKRKQASLSYREWGGYKPTYTAEFTFIPWNLSINAAV